MRLLYTIVAVVTGSLGLSAAALAQGTPGPGGGASQMMHDWGMGWGWGGMFLGPLFMIVWLAILVAVIVLVVRWLGGGTAITGPRGRSARDMLDERYAKGEIDREEYLRRRQDIAGP